MRIYEELSQKIHDLYLSAFPSANSNDCAIWEKSNLIGSENSNAGRGRSCRLSDQLHSGNAVKLYSAFNCVNEIAREKASSNTIHLVLYFKNSKGVWQETEKFRFVNKVKMSDLNEDLLQQLEGSTIVLSSGDQNEMEVGMGDAETQELVEEIIGTGEGDHHVVDEQQLIDANVSSMHDLITLHAVDTQGNIISEGDQVIDEM